MGEGDNIVNSLESDSVEISGTAEPGSTVTVEIVRDGSALTTPEEVIADEDGNWTVLFNLTDIADGPAEVLASVVDDVGNQSKNDAVIPITISTVAAEVEINSPLDGQVFNGDETDSITITGKFEPNSKLMVTLDGDFSVSFPRTTNATGDWELTFGFDVFDDGEVNITATATDSAGNPSRDAITIILNAVPPTLLINAPSQGELINADESTSV